ncbi:HIT domain-containing protein [Streptomyces zaomyceticus]|uniref:HIT domain-containing protein n=1 Tax=Streptomyces zaomyceticus TaxID=68286 RepID=UPI00366A389A
MAQHPNANLVTNKGIEATQTVFRLHVHVLAREKGDGSTLPCTPQHADVENRARP